MNVDSAILSSASVETAAAVVPRDASIASAKKAGEDFEAFFLSQAFEQMYSGVDADPLFGGGNGESIFRSMLIQEYSKVAAKSGTTGIGAEVTREILRLQEAQGGK